MSIVEEPGHPIQARLSQWRHDLRTPVNAIIGYSEMLVEDAASRIAPEAQTLLEQLPALGKQLLLVINTVLDAARCNRMDDPLDWQALADELQQGLREPIRQIMQQCETLLQQAPQLGLLDCSADLQRVREACQRLLDLLQQPLPMHRPSTPPIHVTPSPADSAHTLHGHILIVDDNDFNRDLLVRTLGRLGLTCSQAQDGQQALDLMRATGFDLILLDVTMPVLNGVEVLAQLKRDPRWQHIPVLMISALDELDTVAHCIEIGAEDYLSKPFNPVLLKARLEACLEKKRLRDHELEYLRQVTILTAAAAAVEAGTFEPDSVSAVAQRTDALGQLARVFQTMAREVRAREQRLQQQVQQLRIEIDQQRKARHVAEVTESSYFQELQQKIDDLRKKRKGGTSSR